LPDFNEPESSRQIFEKYISNFMKIHPVKAALFHAGGWTDRRMDRQAVMTKLGVVFHNFADAPKKK
jgi:hypothetical protein